MFTTRPCGCKAQRTCLVCETEFGACKVPTNIDQKDKTLAYVFCPLCTNLIWPGWDCPSTEHPNHKGTPYKFPGIQLILDFISPDEEAQLLQNIDEVPWDPSQSGRSKQNYGPKCNFKKKKIRLGGFEGYPAFTQFLQDRFKSIDILKDFMTAEQCSLEYTTERGSSIDPHVDDCWIWGERIPTLSLQSDSILTLQKLNVPTTKYNLTETFNYPQIVNSNGTLRTEQEIIECYEELKKKSTNAKSEFQALNNEFSDSSSTLYPKLVRIPMPRRSLLVFYGSPRYEWQHGILREDITSRRVCITYRELTPTYLKFGSEVEIGRQILLAGQNFWNHSEKYNLV